VVQSQNDETVVEVAARLGREAQSENILKLR